MAPNRRYGTHANWASILFCALLVLSTTGFASASLLHWRQDDVTPTQTAEDTATAVESNIPDTTQDGTPLASIIAPTTPEEPTATDEDTVPEATEQPTATDEDTVPEATEEPTATDGDTVPEATITPAANSTLPSNSTEDAQLTSAAAAAPTVIGVPLNETNDPNECHVDRTDTPEFEGNPFCLPVAGQIVQADGEIDVTWDTSLFPANTTATVEVEYFDDPTDKTASTVPLEGLKAPNSDGEMYINMTSSWLKGQSSANLTLFFVSEDESVLTGPTILLMKNNSTASSGSKKKLGEEVGIPIGLVFIGGALFVIGAFVCLRRRAKGFTVTGKPRDQGISAATGGTAATRGHRRDPSFHDEPTRGVELQDRNKAYAGNDNWDWGSPVSSPTRGGMGSNVFRDEVGRQKVGRGY